MRSVVFTMVLAALSVSLATGARASCVGGIGSATLDCTSNAGTLSDFKGWVTNTYVPQAIAKAMTSFAFEYNSHYAPGMTGYSQIADEWSQWSKRSVDIVQVETKNVGMTYAADNSFVKDTSQFTIDKYNSGGGANVWFRIRWTGTIAETINGITNYFATYVYDFSADAWGATNKSGSVTWLANGTIGTTTGAGRYALTNNVAPVPGPEAGAGLGAVALGSLAFYRKRRRDRATAA